MGTEIENQQLRHVPNEKLCLTRRIHLDDIRQRIESAWGGLLV